MPHNSYAGMAGSCSATFTSSSSEKGEDVRQGPTSFPNISQALYYTTPNPQSPTLACPVSGCSLVFKGEIAHGYLWRHLKRPGVSGRTGSEKTAWLNLHKTEHDRLLATRSITSLSLNPSLKRYWRIQLVTPAQRKRDARKAKAQKLLRTAEFELRARNMGIIEKSLIAQKVMIWEGIYGAEQSGDSIGVSIHFSSPFRRLLYDRC